MQWFSSIPAGDGVTMLTEPHVHDYMRANLWHVRGSDLDLVIDTGMGLAPLMPQLDLKPGKPLLAVATHIHLDHVGSLHEFSDRAGPRQEAALFDTMPEEATYAYMFRELADAVSAAPASGWDIASYRIAPAPLTRVLDEGDIVDLGSRRFRVLHLPGHSPGSIGLFDEQDGTFFSGDAIHGSTLIDDLPDSDREAYRRTMERIRTLPVRIVHGGHGESLDAARMCAIAERYLTGGRP